MCKTNILPRDKMILIGGEEHNKYKDLVRQVTVLSLVYDMQDMMIPKDKAIPIARNLVDIANRESSGNLAVQHGHICSNALMALKELGYDIVKKER